MIEMWLGMQAELGGVSESGTRLLKSLYHMRAGLSPFTW